MFACSGSFASFGARRSLAWAKPRPLCEPSLGRSRDHVSRVQAKTVSGGRRLCSPEDDIESRRSDLERLFNHFGPLLFNHASCPYSSPPAELFEPPSFQQLWVQYYILRDTVLTIMRDYPKQAAEILQLVAVVIQTQGALAKQVQTSRWD